MTAAAVAIWISQTIGFASALSGRQQGIAEILASADPSAGVPHTVEAAEGELKAHEGGVSRSLFAWSAGDEEAGGGPEQVSGVEGLARSFALDRKKPKRKAVNTTVVKKKRKHWPAHLQARLLLPEAKVAFCYMPKVASAQMSSMFGELNGIDEDYNDPWEASGPKALNISWANVTKANGWKFAFFTRDPLARYLSAFGSKCLPNSDGIVEGNGKDCLGKITWHFAPMEQLVQTFEERARNDTKKGRPANNSHWFSQSTCLRACGIDRFHPKAVDFIGNLDNDAHAEVTRMFDTLGVSAAYPQAKEVVEKYFPSEGAGHSSRSHNKQEPGHVLQKPHHGVAGEQAVPGGLRTPPPQEAGRVERGRGDQPAREVPRRRAPDPGGHRQHRRARGREEREQGQADNQRRSAAHGARAPGLVAALLPLMALAAARAAAC
ncbi:unnamed protein product [Prorocentrum cordatum]|uniref:Sulfotransferase n=1 Tax=Prorocentrum cordatum TaxID=2364126 RepID=A0ABN9X140_9DINO|nr:unnamed protein product [Polarella glacialis]